MLFKKFSKISVIWLAFKGIVRYNLWFIVKLIIFVLWGLTLVNIGIFYFLPIDLKYNFLQKWILIISILVLNFIFFLFSYTLFTLTTKKRQNEFAILRSLGATRSEIFKLILQESIIIPLISSILTLFIEIFLLLEFKVKICGILNIHYSIKFIEAFLKSFICVATLEFLIIFICLLPSAIYFARLDPYHILKY